MADTRQNVAAPPRDRARPELRTEPAPMPIRDQSSDNRSFGDLIKELGDESATLIRQEALLAKVEMRHKLRVYERNAAKLAIGGVLLLGAVLVLLVAINRGLTALLTTFMGIELAVWIAPLALALVVAIIGWSMVSSAKHTIAHEGASPEQTLASLREDRNWVKQEVEEARNG